MYKAKVYFIKKIVQLDINIPWKYGKKCVFELNYCLQELGVQAR